MQLLWPRINLGANKEYLDFLKYLKWSTYVDIHLNLKSTHLYVSNLQVQVSKPRNFPGLFWRSAPSWEVNWFWIVTWLVTWLAWHLAQWHYNTDARFIELCLSFLPVYPLSLSSSRSALRTKTRAPPALPLPRRLRSVPLPAQLSQRT